MYIGQPHPSWSGDSFYKGTLDEVRLYNRALSEYEIQELYNLTEVGPLGYLGRIRQSPLHGDPGTTFTQSGAGFTPNSTVTLHFRNQLGEELTPIQLATDAQGGFSINYTAPQDKPFGTHTWWAVDDTTGRQSATIGYQITGPIGTQTNLPIGPPPAIIPVAQGDDIFGTLMRPFPFDPGKESFVIVHGWNPDDSPLLPGWVVQMGSAIHSDPKSQAPGANVFYWNWQDKARSKDTSIFQFGSGVEPVDYIQAVLSVPFDNVTDSGKMLANALQLAIPAGYDKKIHLVGHSLGTGVITYATKRALSDKYNYHYKNNIEHLTFLDSPWLFDRPADSFLKSIENKVFFDNYWSMWGKGTGYWESDTNIYLQRHFKLFEDKLSYPHAYSHLWYRSSVTNFSDKTILDDISTPSNTIPYGFYWWDENKRSNVSSAYIQTGPYHYNLEAFPIEEVVGAIVDAYGYTKEMAAETLQKLAETAGRTKKKITIIAVNTYNSATDIAGYLVGELNHAVQQTGPCVDFACGWLFLQHHSDAIVSTTITIPPEANALSFGYEFKYADQGGMLELIIEDLSVFHAFSHEEIGNGYQMAPWIDVSKLSGQQVRLTFRLSNPTQDSEGGCLIDDLIFAKIEEIDTDQDFLPNITENIAQCLVSSDADTDDDGIKDGDEDKNYNGIVDTGETNPCNDDTDGDGIQDGTELGVTQPVPDPDDAAGPLLGTDTAKFQPDLDPATKTDPLNADTDGDGLKDGEEDKNHNGRVDAGETDPAEKTAKDAAPVFFPIQDKNGGTTIIYIE